MNWSHVPLGEILAPAPVRRAGNEEYPILSMTMSDGLVLQSDKFKKRVASRDTANYRVVKNGELVVGFPIDEAVLAVQRVSDAGIVSPAYKIWTIDKELADELYLERYLRSEAAIAYYVSNLRSSTARRRVLPDDKFRGMPIPLPSLEQQKKIVAILDKADAIRRKREQAVDLADEFLKSVFLEMFGNVEWPTRPLSEVVSEGTIVTYGIVQAGPEYDGGVPYIRTGDIKNGEIVLGNLRHTSPKIAAKFARSTVRAGEIVMSIRATVGTTALVPEELDGANLTQGTARISPGEMVTTEYLLHFLRSQRCQDWISRQIKGATFREITLTRLREMEVPVPPMEIQQRFSKLTETASILVGRFNSDLAQAENLFGSLSQRAFRGEL